MLKAANLAGCCAGCSHVNILRQPAMCKLRSLVYYYFAAQPCTVNWKRTPIVDISHAEVL